MKKKCDLQVKQSRKHHSIIRAMKFKNSKDEELLNSHMLIVCNNSQHGVEMMQIIIVNKKIIVTKKKIQI